MRIAKIVMLAFASLMLSATLATAKTDKDRMPNYDCDKQVNACIADCDKAADTSKNARNYERCIGKCNKMGEECGKRQEVATGCAEGFKECIANANTEKQKESCRSSYRKCKGEQK